MPRHHRQAFLEPDLVSFESLANCSVRFAHFVVLALLARHSLARELGYASLLLEWQVAGVDVVDPAKD